MASRPYVTGTRDHQGLCLDEFLTLNMDSNFQLVLQDWHPFPSKIGSENEVASGVGLIEAQLKLLSGVRFEDIFSSTTTTTTSTTTTTTSTSTTLAPPRPPPPTSSSTTTTTLMPVPKCSVPVVSVGIFRVGTALFYSTGSHYCLYQDWEKFKQATGIHDISTIRNFSETPCGMVYDGICVY